MPEPLGRQHVQIRMYRFPHHTIRLAGFYAVLILLFIICGTQLTKDRNMIFQSNAEQRLQERDRNSSFRKDPWVAKVQKSDRVYRKGDWDSGSPIVLEEFKLVFFTIDTSASTSFKMLFSRMMGYSDQKVKGHRKWLRLIPFTSKTNELKHLYDFDVDQATRMMTSPQWTRAMFVRDPKERFLAAYLAKAANPETNFMRKCCLISGECVETARESLSGFFSVVRVCDDAHWRGQTWRVDARFWPFINFVGHTDSLAGDTERLLKKIGAWDQFGKQGWGENGDEHVFSDKAGGSGAHHYTFARSKMTTFITPEMETEIDEFYADDYANPILGLKKVALFDPSTERHKTMHLF